MTAGLPFFDTGSCILTDSPFFSTASSSFDEKMKVSGAVALVTGGASGIGKAICQKLLENGGKVCIVDIQDEIGVATAKTFSDAFSSDDVIFAHCDVTKQDSLKAAFDKAIAAYGKLDIVCNNAGIFSENEWEKTIQINIVGVIRGMKLAIEHMGIQHGGNGGVIVNTSSIGGLYPQPMGPTYSATKAAVSMYTKSMSMLHGEKQGVRINAICPALVDTQLVDMTCRDSAVPEEEVRALLGQLKSIKPADVADAVLQLITDDTKNGTLLQVFPSGLEEFQYSELPFSKIMQTM